MFEAYFNELHNKLIKEYLYDVVDKETVYNVGHHIYLYLRKLKNDQEIKDFNCYLYEFKHDFKHELNKVSYIYKIEIYDFHGNKEVRYIEVE